MNNLINTGAPLSLFVKADNIKAFPDVLSEIQGFISSNYSGLISEAFDKEKREEVKIQLKRFISKYIMDNRIGVDGINAEQLVSAIYTEMAEFSFLTKYIFNSLTEEVNSATRS